VSAFEVVFGVPAEHSLRLVRHAACGGVRLWEHEERDASGGLVAVYESWPRRDGGLDFVKYSPYGWVVGVSGRSPRLPPHKARVRPIAAA
jgi:hypothetical protein